MLRKPADPTRDPYDAQPAPATVASGVRAHFSTPRGEEAVRGGSQVVVTDNLTTDPVDLQHTDQVKDEATNKVYDVVWVSQRVGLGLDHTAAGVRRIEGAV